VATNTRLSATVEAALHSTVGLRQLIGCDRSGSVCISVALKNSDGGPRRPDCTSRWFPAQRPDGAIH
jgi:hypothetical protein